MNVILVISDSMRRDCLGVYGAPPWAAQFKTGIGRVHTPHLDRFASRSIVFDNAFIASFPTVPTRNDILTGRYTWTYKPWAPLDEDEITLPEALNQAGVLTGLVADTPHPFAPGYNYQRGFQSWEVIRGQENDRWHADPESIEWPAAKRKLRNPDTTVVQYLRNTSRRQGEEDYFPARTFRHAAQWLERNHKREPFFLYIDTFDPHEPWDPPDHYTDLYDPGYTGEKVIYPRYDYCDYLSEEELTHCRALYSGEVTMVDRWFGYLFERIESLGLLESTAVFFLSDHGFYLGEHGYIGKVILTPEYQQSIPLYSEVARIPLLVHLPRHFNTNTGSRIGSFVQTADLMPTICDLLAVEIPQPVRSGSFVFLLKGEAGELSEFVICSPTISHPGIEVPHPTTRASIYDRDWLLVYGAQVDSINDEETTRMVDSVLRNVKALETGPIRPKLYSLRNAGGELKDVLAENTGIAQGLHQKFVGFLEKNGVPEQHLKFLRTI